ncbi:MAG: hypothetical protein U5L08_04545 [Xanthomonadales bacterium]|nr:hypothetical protein [Xanthomonadales bacterium]
MKDVVIVPEPGCWVLFELVYCPVLIADIRESPSGQLQGACSPEGWFPFKAAGGIGRSGHCFASSSPPLVPRQIKSVNLKDYHRSMAMTSFHSLAPAGQLQSNNELPAQILDCGVAVDHDGSHG